MSDGSRSIWIVDDLEEHKKKLEPQKDSMFRNLLVGPYWLGTIDGGCQPRSELSRQDAPRAISQLSPPFPPTYSAERCSNVCMYSMYGRPVRSRLVEPSK